MFLKKGRAFLLQPKWFYGKDWTQVNNSSSIRSASFRELKHKPYQKWHNHLIQCNHVDVINFKIIKLILTFALPLRRKHDVTFLSQKLCFSSQCWRKVRGCCMLEWRDLSIHCWVYTACALLSVRGRASLRNGRGWPYGTKLFSNFVSSLCSKAIFPYPCLLKFSLSLKKICFPFYFPWF